VKTSNPQGSLNDFRAHRWRYSALDAREADMTRKLLTHTLSVLIACAATAAVARADE
jgi:hypothetical protein